jgi:hypothetical protein
VYVFPPVWRVDPSDSLFQTQEVVTGATPPVVVPGIKVRSEPTVGVPVIVPGEVIESGTVTMLTIASTYALAYPMRIFAV